MHLFTCMQRVDFFWARSPACVIHWAHTQQLALVQSRRVCITSCTWEWICANSNKGPTERENLRRLNETLTPRRFLSNSTWHRKTLSALVYALALWSRRYLPRCCFLLHSKRSAESATRIAQMRNMADDRAKGSCGSTLALNSGSCHFADGRFTLNFFSKYPWYTKKLYYFCRRHRKLYKISILFK